MYIPTMDNPFLVSIGAIVFFALVMPLFGSKKWKASGKHVFITGGSQGLGLAVAQHLASKGAHVTICSRTESKLKQAVETVKASVKVSDQKVNYVAADVSTFEGAKTAIAACQSIPDTVICCAGGAKPGFFLEQTEKDFEAGIKTDYMTCLSTSHAAANVMVHNGIKNGRIVLVSSTLGLMGLIGYTQYSPMKHAIRGLAECLRSELQLYGIKVQTFFPAGILSPGYDEENKTKPKITLEIEKDDTPLSPQQCAKSLVHGIERNHFFITADFVTNLFRVSALGAAPTNHVILDRLTSFISWLGLPAWRTLVADKKIQQHRTQHYKDLGIPSR